MTWKNYDLAVGEKTVGSVGGMRGEGNYFQEQGKFALSDEENEPRKLG